ncbi:hypothetical protein J6590_055077 [Homalodisca vitripennis]|nr:hypothetical protein J6590_055077 [Homalodisca vitripennis]
MGRTRSVMSLLEEEETSSVSASSIQSVLGPVNFINPTVPGLVGWTVDVWSLFPFVT